MSDGITTETTATVVIAALIALGDTAQPFVNTACAETAAAVVVEARTRLQRQLGPNATGATLAGITSRPAYDGNGSVVVDEREPFPNLPLWIEKGTKKGKPGSHTAPARPFFYVSALLEQGAHVTRLEHALAQTIDASGLGD